MPLTIFRSIYNPEASKFPYLLRTMLRLSSRSITSTEIFFAQISSQRIERISV